MKLSIAFGVCALPFSLPASAQSVQEILKSPEWSKGATVTDGAEVYDKPDFDATVIENLPYHTTVYILKKSVSSPNGMGLFHRVRFKNKAGYMADTDVRMNAKDIEKDKTVAALEGKKAAKKHKSKAWDEDDEAAMGPQPMYFRRYVGLNLARVNFTEKFSGHRLSDQMIFAGLRLTGPGVVFDALPIDMNILFTTQKPGYYKDITSQSVQGFAMLGDLGPTLPIYDRPNQLVYYGVGLMWAYTNYAVHIGEKKLDSQEFKIGFDFDVGYAYRIKTVALRADARYFWEQTRYLGLFLAVQSEY